MSSPQVDYTMRTLAAKHLGAARSELAAADVPGRLTLLPPLDVDHTWGWHVVRRLHKRLSAAKCQGPCQMYWQP